VILVILDNRVSKVQQAAIQVVKASRVIKVYKVRLDLQVQELTQVVKVTQVVKAILDILDH
jgi:hypothetical protein